MSREITICWGNNQKLVTALSDAGARFMVIGGTAVRFHAPARREPGDLDLLVEPSAEMLGQLNRALALVGCPRITAPPAVFAQPNKGFTDKRTCNVDILTPLDGIDFAEHWAAAEVAVMAYTATAVRVASVETLILWLQRALEAEPTRAEGITGDLEILERVRQRQR